MADKETKPLREVKGLVQGSAAHLWGSWTRSTGSEVGDTKGGQNDPDTANDGSVDRNVRA